LSPVLAMRMPHCSSPFQPKSTDVRAAKSDFVIALLKHAGGLQVADHEIVAFESLTRFGVVA
jgi:hypothetical protein